MELGGFTNEEVNNFTSKEVEYIIKKLVEKGRNNGSNHVDEEKGQIDSAQVRRLKLSIQLISIIYLVECVVKYCKTDTARPRSPTRLCLLCSSPTGMV